MQINSEVNGWEECISSMVNLTSVMKCFLRLWIKIKDLLFAFFVVLLSKNEWKVKRLPQPSFFFCDLLCLFFSQFLCISKFTQNTLCVVNVFYAIRESGLRKWTQRPFFIWNSSASTSFLSPLKGTESVFFHMRFIILEVYTLEND